MEMMILKKLFIMDMMMLPPLNGTGAAVIDDLTDIDIKLPMLVFVWR
ncbi:uncharacterized protein LOC110226905 [Arabidopsis lyrata subsp. lyrata]|nr:uncharacterized protein LOC110225055 [Arabidopsis lyrata subsp. lyrata]XP_020875492.1 uncharacterized protein LOC110226905 [Arabidopsis lyrata subsp. lyrata]|eukprot:XP_020869361.1 uncharacterized protein LOC110225055 [Arabidopsis lyrata subsp. lyrata]